MKRVDLDQIANMDTGTLEHEAARLQHRITQMERQAAPLRPINEKSKRRARQHRATLARRITRKAA